jgi:hypothetical protein
VGAPRRPGHEAAAARLRPHTATQDLDRIVADLGRRPDAGLAIACAPSGLLVLDPDRRHGGDIATLERAGELPPTWRVGTPGGWHLYFQHPGIETRGQLDETLFPGIDVRNDAYVFAPPTRRSDGSRYVLESDDDPAPLGWLIELVRAPEHSAPHGSSQGAGPWERAHSWADILEPARWTYVFSRNGQEYWRRPGKDDGWSAATNYTGADTLKNWSTSTGLPTEGTCTKFYVWAHLHHRGDLSAAGKAKAAWLRVHAAAWTKQRTSSDEPSGATPDVALALPPDFWDARESLDHIRRAAWSQGRSAEAVLGTTLARAVADTLHTVTLDTGVGAPCSLSLLVAILSPPGFGKSSSAAIAVRLMPGQLLLPATDNVPPGSGEGLIELLYDTVTEEIGGKQISERRQEHHNCFVYCDEAEVLVRQTNRQSGSTILPVMRTIFTGGTLGQANATKDRYRIVPAGRYVYGIVLGLQPDRADALFGDTGAGTPQRMLWLSSQTPIPAPAERPYWPGPLKWGPPPSVLRLNNVVDIAPAVLDEIQANDYIRQTQGCPPLDVHHDLIRAKTAEALSLLDRRANLTDEDWQLAGQITDLSRNVRTFVLRHIEELDAQQESTYRSKLAGRAVATDNAVRTRRVVDAARAIAHKTYELGEWTVRKARRAIRREPEIFDAGLAHALAEGWVVEATEPSHTGDDKRVLRPGPKRPR